MKELSNWLLGILSSIVIFLIVNALQFRQNVSKEYVLKDDFVRTMQENRNDHQIMFDKLDEVLKELGKKADR